MPGWLMRRPLPGISACPASAGQHVLLGLRFQELSWDHTSPEEEEPVLWLEFDGDSEGTPVNKLLRIYSKQVGRHYPPPVPRHLAAGSVLGSGGCTEGAGGLRSPVLVPSAHQFSCPCFSLTARWSLVPVRDGCSYCPLHSCLGT